MVATATQNAVETGGTLLFRLMRALIEAESDEVRCCCGVTTGQGLALLAMDAPGQTTMGDVKKALGVSAGTATRVVDNLVRDGLVERTGRALDRRCVCLRPTARGRNTIKKLTKCYARFWELTFKGIPKNRLRETLSALELVVDAVEKARAACCPIAGGTTSKAKEGATT